MAAHRAGWIGCAAGVVLVVSIAGTSAGPAAAEVSETIRTDVTALVEDLTGVSGLSSFEYDKIDIAEEGSGYRVTLAGVRLLQDTDDRLKVGDVVLALEPDGDGYRITSVDLPATIQILSSVGSPAGLLHFGGFGLTGKWQRSTSVLAEVDLALDDLMVNFLATETSEETQITVGTGVMRSRLAPAEDGAWREEVSAELRELRRQEGDAVDTLSSIALESVTEGIDLERQRQLQQLMIEASQNPTAAEVAVDPALLASMRALSDTIRATRFRLSAQGLEIDQDHSQPVVVPRIEFSQTAEGLDGALARTDFQLEIDQAEMPLAEQAAGVPEAMGPQSLELNVAIEELPWPALWEAFVDLLYAPDAGEEGAWRLGLALQDAGTRLRLDPSRLSSEPIAVTGNGAVQADPAAAVGAVASFAFEIVGLAAAQSLAMEASEADVAIDALGQLDAMGTPAIGPDDNKVHRYDIVLGADGVLTINGEPFSLVEGAAQ